MCGVHDGTFQASVAEDYLPQMKPEDADYFIPSLVLPSFFFNQ